MDALGTLLFTIKVENGEMCPNFPRLDVTGDENYKELISKIPNGTYRWALHLKLEDGHKID